MISEQTRNKKSIDLIKFLFLLLRNKLCETSSQNT